MFQKEQIHQRLQMKEEVHQKVLRAVGMILPKSPLKRPREHWKEGGNWGYSLCYPLQVRLDPKTFFHLSVRPISWPKGVSTCRRNNEQTARVKRERSYEQRKF